MGWIVAWLVFAIFLSTGVTGVNSPVLYSFFISTVLVGSLWAGSCLIDFIFGIRK